MCKRFILVKDHFGTGIVDRTGEGWPSARPTVIIRDKRFAQTMARCLAAHTCIFNDEDAA